MCILRVHDVIEDRILVSRESAHLLENALRAMMTGPPNPGAASGATPLTVDFDGVQGVAPSFLDELLSIFESLVVPGIDGRGQCLTIANPPTRLSLKFEAVARGHGMSVEALPGGSWLLAGARNSPA